MKKPKGIIIFSVIFIFYGLFALLISFRNYQFYKSGGYFNKEQVRFNILIRNKLEVTKIYERLNHIDPTLREKFDKIIDEVVEKDIVYHTSFLFKLHRTLVFVMALWAIIIGIGLFNFKEWARLSVFWFAILFMFVSIFYILEYKTDMWLTNELYFLTDKYRFGIFLMIAYTISILFIWIISPLYYFTRPQTKKYFNKK